MFVNNCCYSLTLTLSHRIHECCKQPLEIPGKNLNEHITKYILNNNNLPIVKF